MSSLCEKHYMSMETVPKCWKCRIEQLEAREIGFIQSLREMEDKLERQEAYYMGDRGRIKELETGKSFDKAKILELKAENERLREVIAIAKELVDDYTIVDKRLKAALAALEDKS